MIQREDEAVKQGWLKNYERLFGPMRDSWESGGFWVIYAAGNNFAFDAIYWQKVDQRFFEPATCVVGDIWKQRLDDLAFWSPKRKM
jgi:hypothetical protein